MYGVSEDSQGVRYEPVRTIISYSDIEGEIRLKENIKNKK